MLSMKKQHEDVLFAFIEYKTEHKAIILAEHAANTEILEEDLQNARCV